MWKCLVLIWTLERSIFNKIVFLNPSLSQPSIRWTGKLNMFISLIYQQFLVTPLINIKTTYKPKLVKSILSLRFSFLHFLFNLVNFFVLFLCFPAQLNCIACVNKSVSQIEVRITEFIIYSIGKKYYIIVLLLSTKAVQNDRMGRNDI